jgi:hypothetical protein
MGFDEKRNWGGVNLFALDESEVKNTGSSFCMVTAQVKPEGCNQVEDER